MCCGAYCCRYRPGCEGSGGEAALDLPLDHLWFPFSARPSLVLKSGDGGSAREEEEEAVVVVVKVVIVRDSVTFLDGCFRLSSSNDDDEDDADVGFGIRSWEMRGILVSGMFRASFVVAVDGWEDVLELLGRVGFAGVFVFVTVIVEEEEEEVEEVGLVREVNFAGFEHDTEDLAEGGLDATGDFAR